jgi:hypothetical protein
VPPATTCTSGYACGGGDSGGDGGRNGGSGSGGRGSGGSVVVALTPSKLGRNDTYALAGYTSLPAWPAPFSQGVSGTSTAPSAASEDTTTPGSSVVVPAPAEGGSSSASGPRGADGGTRLSVNGVVDDGGGGGDQDDQDDHAFMPCMPMAHTVPHAVTMPAVEVVRVGSPIIGEIFRASAAQTASGDLFRDAAVEAAVEAGLN